MEYRGFTIIVKGTDMYIYQRGNFVKRIEGSTKLSVAKSKVDCIIARNRQ